MLLSSSYSIAYFEQITIVPPYAIYYYKYCQIMTIVANYLHSGIWTDIIFINLLLITLIVLHCSNSMFLTCYLPNTCIFAMMRDWIWIYRKQMREEEVVSSHIPTLLLGYLTDKRRLHLNNNYNMTPPMISMDWYVNGMKEWMLVVYPEAKVVLFWFLFPNRIERSSFLHFTKWSTYVFITHML